MLKVSNVPKLWAHSILGVDILQLDWVLSRSAIKKVSYLREKITTTTTGKRIVVTY